MVPKFRAWNGYRKIMADYVSAIQNGDTQGTPSSVNVIVNGKNETWDIKNDHVELLQSTGLKDANGKEIYEGDIIVSKPNDPTFEPLKIGVVKCSKIDAGWSYRTATDEYNIWTSGKYRTYEIIGNVYENPELLEAQHDTRTD
ncbi:YopX family protein [Levilactobacillus brevis]|uniref:YopX family protein n=1 Tax=Levilactobacillus brevis TaxID=1580 RepID=UPI003DA032E4